MQSLRTTACPTLSAAVVAGIVTPCSIYCRDSNTDMDLSLRRQWPRQLLAWFVLLLMLIFNIQQLPSFERPRRVFTRGFVMFCVFVVVFELLLLNHYYG
ncbi:hypothetical protein [Pseudomonas sp. UFMG81]|uniref:hypothetical protein n=1 Tax=Pseudomonas sp. UFMG81 TaxID=2745936 RepID=UPI00188EA1A4|nr:hypothetical protein [Pseudomonas sp. UFMG81]